MTKIAITGASGFLGKALVQAARSREADVIAIYRSVADPIWEKDTAITPVQLDLGHADSPAMLGSHLKDVDVVIHAAASLAGGADAHVRDTVGATRYLLEAMETATKPPRLVLVSSLSVYDVANMQDQEVLNEESALISDASDRDAYAAGKLAQEVLVRASTLQSTIIRPGAIYGVGRLWSAQLGFAKAGRVVCPGGQARVPAIAVEHAAAAIVTASINTNDMHTVNLIDPNPPTQLEWLSAIDQKTLRVPRGLVLLGGQLLGRGTAWRARFRPLQYDTTKAVKLLGSAPLQGFAAMVAAAKRQEDSQT